MKLTYCFLLSLIFLISSPFSSAQTIEMGEYRANYTMPGYILHKGEGERTFLINIPLRKKFVDPPQIFISVTALEAETSDLKDNPTKIRYYVEPELVTQDLLIIKVVVWGNCRILALNGNWIAFESD